MKKHEQISAPVRLRPTLSQPVGLAQMRLVAALMDDPNPIHFSAAAAARAGLGDKAIVQGPVTLTEMLNYAALALGSIDCIQRATIRFLGPVHEGERIGCNGEIAADLVDAAITIIDCTASVGKRPVAAMRIKTRVIRQTKCDQQNESECCK